MLSVFEAPWGRFTFADRALARASWRATIATSEVDVLIAGPLTRVGMSEAGTLQDVVAFMALIADLRDAASRLDRDPDPSREQVAAASRAPGRARATRCCTSRRPGTGTRSCSCRRRAGRALTEQTLKLAWTDGEGFRLEADRDLFAEVQELLADGTWRTSREIAVKRERGGVGANHDAVKAVLDGNPDVFQSRTGADAVALGRHAAAVVWGLAAEVAQSPEPPEPLPGFSGVGTGGGSVAPPLREPPAPEPPHLTDSSLAQGSEPPGPPHPSEAPDPTASAGPPETSTHDGRETAREDTA